MEPPYLPTELLQPIIDELVEVIGLKNALKLRFVNSRFSNLSSAKRWLTALELFDEIIMKNIFDGCACRKDAPYILEIPPILTNFLRSKLKPNLPRNTDLGATIHESIEVLLSFQNIEDSTELASKKEQYLEILIESCADISSWKTLSYRLIPYKGKQIPGEFSLEARRGALICAAAVGDLKSMRHIIGLGVVIDDVDGNFGNPTTTAARNNQFDATWLLLECGSKYKGRLRRTSAPLAVAASKGYLDIVKLVLKHQYKWKGERKGSVKENLAVLTAIKSAYRNGHQEVFMFLRTQSREPNTALDFKCLTDAAMRGDMRFVDRFLASGITPQLSIWGPDPLEMASMRGHITVVRLLLEQLTGSGTFCAPHSKYVGAALHYAATEGHKEIVELLLDHGAHINNTYKNLSSPIINATDEIVIYLLEKGAEIISNGAGPHLIRRACSQGNKLLVKKLLDAGVNAIEAPFPSVQGRPHKHNGPGNPAANWKFGSKPVPPIWVATAYGHEPVVRLLLQHGASPPIFWDTTFKRYVAHVATFQYMTNSTGYCFPHGNDPNRGPPPTVALTAKSDVFQAYSKTRREMISEMGVSNFNGPAIKREAYTIGRGAKY